MQIVKYLKGTYCTVFYIINMGVLFKVTSNALTDVYF